METEGSSLAPDGPLPNLCMAPCHPGLLGLMLETLPDPAPPAEAVPVSLLCLLHTLAVGTAPDLPIPYSYL